MGEPMPKDLDPNACFEYVCSSCGEIELRPAASDPDNPRCHCGVLLWPVADTRPASDFDDVCGERFLDELFQASAPGDKPMRLRHEAEPLEEESEYEPLDHPHHGASCEFCAVRRLYPTQHRLWCRVFLFRECSCGYDRR